MAVVWAVAGVGSKVDLIEMVYHAVDWVEHWPCDRNSKQQKAQ